MFRDEKAGKSRGKRELTLFLRREEKGVDPFL